MADFIEINADLHMHGLYSGAVSKDMIPSKIAEQAPLKGLQLVGSSDVLHDKWCKLLKEQLKVVDDSILESANGTKFILQTEVEDSNRVHHIILFPGFSKVDEVKERLRSKCKDLNSDGRPKLWINSEELAEICIDAGCLIGFSHAFTPYFGLFSKFNSYKQCYGSKWNKIYFLELGLSADTDMADRISELHDLTFTSNSDAHSPWPNKLGREFNTLRIRDVSFDEVAKALKHEAGRKCVLNVGFNPLEGKYHKTRCIGCLGFFEPKDAERLGWRCSNCGKPIKKGVDYRIDELADLPLGSHPDHRPGYKHIIPLSEIIALALGISNAWSVKVQSVWKDFIDRFGTEINVLLNVEIDELNRFNPKIAEYIGFFRDEKIRYIPGGAGVYGKLVKPSEDITINKIKTGQKSLQEF